ncbi:MAG: FAD-dependent oxidoreductase [Solirubrobacteraceae bacterium]
MRCDKKSSRKFSLVNAPHDNRRLVIATRSGATGYKHTLWGLRTGDEVVVQKVKGDLVLRDRPDRPVVLIAGGIGIAPFISILRDLDHRDRLRGVTLLYFNRTPTPPPTSPNCSS